MRIIATLCIAFLISTVAPPANAQFNPNTFSSPELTIELQPPYPRPGETVSASINDYRGGVYGASIAWVYGGQVIESANNKRQASFTAGPSGQTQVVQAVLTNADGTKEVLQVALTPTYLDIVIEPQTHVPDFYYGRALPSVGSIVNATALVGDSGTIDPNLIYTWRLNREVLEGGPIRGRNQVSFTMPRDFESTLSLQVTRPDGTVVASRAILLSLAQPELYFYEVSSLFGVKTITTGNAYTLIGPSAVLRAEPYYLDSRVYNNPGLSQWEVDGVTTSGFGGNPYEATVQRTKPTGQASLSYHVRSVEQVLQGVESEITINF